MEDFIAARVLHILGVVLVVSLATIAGASAGSHGWSFGR